MNKETKNNTSIAYSALEHYYINVFDRREAEEVVKIGTSNMYKQERASIADMSSDLPVPDALRKSNVCWFPRDWNTSWIYSRIESSVHNVNNDIFKFKLSGLQALQFTEYDSSYQGHYTWHFDAMRDIETNMVRKLTVAIPLVDESEYTGGELVFRVGDGSEQPVNQTPGTGIIFPSFMLHKVSPVTSGKRYSLVGWFLGPDFV